MREVAHAVVLEMRAIEPKGGASPMRPDGPVPIKASFASWRLWLVRHGQESLRNPGCGRVEQPKEAGNAHPFQPRDGRACRNPESWVLSARGQNRVLGAYHHRDEQT